MYTVTEIFPNAEVGKAVHEYCIQHSAPLPKHIEDYRDTTIEWAEETGADPDMMISPLQAQFLIWFARAMGVEKVLEIGCFTGYSALSWAEALKDSPNAQVTTLDLSSPSTTLAKATFAKHHPNNIIKLIEGDAEKTLDTLAGQKYDLIFIDANKDGYVTYLEKIITLKLLAPCGVVVADNALKRGLADDSERNPASKDPGENNYKHLDRFNKFVRECGELENVLLPVFDGLNFARLK